MPVNWTCPYCNRDQTIVYRNTSTKQFAFDTVVSDEGYLGLEASAVICANPDCQKATISCHIVSAKYNGIETFIPQEKTVLSHHKLRPNSTSKPQPDYIPQVLRNDYYEACQIKDLSPKASATLARRCIQGMIRDFCGIREGTLFKEIEALKKLVDEGGAPKGVSDESIDALHAIREIGNIGAHMEKDINVIVDVDPNEAQVLIELIESLFEEWYVERQKRNDRFAKINEIAAEKKQQKHLPAPKAADD